MDDIKRSEGELVELIRKIRFCLQCKINQGGVVKSHLEKGDEIISKIEMTSRNLPKEQRSMIRRSLRQRKFQMKQLAKEYNQRIGEIRKNKYSSHAGGTAVGDIDIDDEDELCLYGLKIQQEDDKLLDDVIKTVIDTTNIATITATKVHEQTLQLNKIDKNIEDMETEMDRARKKIKQIAAGVARQKLIWCILFAIIMSIIAIILLETGTIKI